MVTAVKRPAGESRGKVAAGPNDRQRHRASPRPYRRYFGPVVPGLGLAATWGFTRPEVVLLGAIPAMDLAWMKIVTCERPWWA